MVEERLSFERIDFRDERFRTSYHFTIEPLGASLQKVGLLHPLIAVEREGRLVLLSGWKRALIFKDLGLEGAETLVLGERNDLTAFRRVFHENRTTRPFTFLDKAMTVLRFKELGEEDKDIKDEVLPLLHMPPTASSIALMIAVARFAIPLKKIIQSKDIHPLSAELLSKMTPRDRSLVTPLLEPVGLNKQRELLENLADLSVREGRPPNEIMSLPEIREVCGNDRLTPVQKSEMVRKALDRAKNPRFWTRRDSFDMTIRKLRLPEKIKIHPPAFFEKKDIALSLSFASLAEFQMILRELIRLSQEREFAELFAEDDVPGE